MTASIALTIAGSDPSGGAGIQADLKTFHQLGVYGEAVVSLLTVQNSCSLTRVECLAPELVLQQIDALLDDMPPSSAKTGALGSLELIEALGTAASGWNFPLVVDPILLAKHGANLAPASAVPAFLTHLVPRATLLMPNLPEAEALCGFPVDSPATMERAARTLSGFGAKSVLIKGGHLAGDPIDLLLHDGRVHRFGSTRISTPHTHGTGCTYSAAITAYLAKGVPLPEAVERAQAFVHRAIAGNPGLGRGSGPLNHWA
jgi:hydroxymethylpyrimidine/phosphomethylpyrimidine kinase